MQIIERPMPNATVTIMPLGDIQYGAQDANLEVLKQHIEIARQNSAYVLGLGDYTDLMSPSNRKRLAAAELYDSPLEAIDEVMFEHVEELYKLLRVLKPRFLGLCHGHHYYRTLSGRTTDQLLAEKLGTDFIGTSAIIGLKFTGGTYSIFATHGTGGGVTAAGHLSRLERMANGMDVDAVLMGHVSKLAATKVQRLVPDFATGELRSRDLILASSGAYFEGYKANRTQGDEPMGSYVEHRLLPPVALGSLLLRVKPRVRGGVWSPRATVEL